MTDAIVTDELEQLLNAPGPECMIEHTAHTHYPKVCSKHATHVVTDCSGVQALICATLAGWLHRHRDNSAFYCLACTQPLGVCWKVRVL